MNWKSSYSVLFMLFILAACNDSKEHKVDVTTQTATIPFNTQHLIEVNDFSKLYTADTFKVVHFGTPKEFSDGHIPGAVNIWRTHIEDTTYPYGGMMANKKQLESLFSSLGIGNNHTLLVYDAVASCDAARLWWVLKNYGFNKVKILNGGIQAWKASGGVVTQNISPVVPSSFELPKVAPMLLIAKHDYVLKTLETNNPTVLIDARTQEEFTGVRQKKGATTAGRVPNSHWINWTTCVNFDGDKKFKSLTELATIYRDLIPNKDQEIITYCHTGVRSAHTTFVLTELLGYTNVKNYDGSWTEWSFLKDYPKQKDSITSILN